MNGAIYSRLYYSIIILILVIGLASAGETNEYQYFKYKEPSKFLTNCFLNDLPCPDTINCTISIYSPKNNTLVNNVPISYDGHLFNFPLSSNDNSIIGTYQAVIYCNNGATFIDKFVVSYDVTGNAKKDPSEFVIVGFGFLFILLLVYLVYMIIHLVGHVFTLDYDILDMAKSIGGYFGLLGIALLEPYYLGNPDIHAWILMVVDIGLYTHIFLPLFSFGFVLIIGPFIKKKLMTRREDRSLNHD